MRSMNARSRLVGLCLLSIVFITSGCSLIEPYREIFGRWRSDQLSFAGIKIPIAPIMVFEQGKAEIGDSIAEVVSYSRQGNLITVNLKDGTSLIFEMLGKDAMTIEVPILGKMHYSRVK